jgi:hypothetical protein
MYALIVIARRIGGARSRLRESGLTLERAAVKTEHTEDAPEAQAGRAGKPPTGKSATTVVVAASRCGWAGLGFG